MTDKDLCYPYTKKMVLTFEFGVTIPVWGKHAGYDFSVKPYIGKPLIEQPLYSIWDGIVLVAKKAGDGSGWYICVHSAKENATIVYWHINRKLLVKAGQSIKKGDVIGYAETSDYSPAHNHIQFNKGKVTKGSWNSAVLDPQPFFNRMVLWTNLTEDPNVIAELQKQVALLQKSIDLYKSDIGKRDETIRGLNAQIKGLVAEIALKSNEVEKVALVVKELQAKVDGHTAELEKQQLLLDAEKRANQDLRDEREGLAAANKTLNDKASNLLDESKKKDDELDKLVAWKLLHESGSLPLSYYMTAFVKRLFGLLPKK